MPVTRYGGTKGFRNVNRIRANKKNRLLLDIGSAEKSCKTTSILLSDASLSELQYGCIDYIAPVVMRFQIILILYSRRNTIWSGRRCRWLFICVGCTFDFNLYLLSTDKGHIGNEFCCIFSRALNSVSNGFLNILSQLLLIRNHIGQTLFFCFGSI